MLGFVIRCCKKFDSLDAIIAVYRSLVLPKLEYACIIWSPQYADRVGQLERVQRRFLKYLYFKKFGIYPYRGFNHEELLKMFCFDSLYIRRVRICLSILIKVIAYLIDCKNFLSLLPFRITNVINTRSRDLFYLHTSRTNLYKNSPVYRVCDLANNYLKNLDIFTLNPKNVNKVLKVYVKN